MVKSDRFVFFTILILAGFGLYEGWRLFWFLTDDAFIVFRYVDNAMHGYGYTWNPPPFRPVEGYTCFLWVLLLHFLWKVTGIEPPVAANPLSLFFSMLTLWMTAQRVMKKDSANRRLVMLALILLGLLTNRTFLTWTSSGLETSLFNCLFLAWILVATSSENQSGGWLFRLTASAALVYCTRPDGILPVLSTLALVLLWFYYAKNRRPSTLLYSLPILVVPLHLLWRKHFYGEWLPNTYYAKYVSPWPEAGIRYLASFILEYGLAVWIALLIVFVAAQARRFSRQAGGLREATASLNRRPLDSAAWILAVTTVVACVFYYVFVIGGDHFEYRVFSFLVPVVFLTFYGMLRILNARTSIAVALLVLLIVAQIPLPWTHWWITRNLKTREQTFLLRAPVRPALPSSLGWYTGAFDELQSWLILRFICVRHQEHKVYFYYLVSRFPSREAGEKFDPGSYPIMKMANVGVPGWVLPHVFILDELGLNDYVIARHEVSAGSMRLMAHQRSAPPGYLESFEPNVWLVAPKKIGYSPRRSELTASKIQQLENEWRSRVTTLKENH